jgi:outer membrane lipoprotein-sorting protein
MKKNIYIIIVFIVVTLFSLGNYEISAKSSSVVDREANDAKNAKKGWESTKSAIKMNEKNTLNLMSKGGQIDENKHSCECDDKIFMQVEQALNGLASFRASFVQEDLVTSKKQEGEFLIKKPGLLKIYYQKPKRILLLLRKNVFLHYDYELDEVSNSRFNSKVFQLFLYKVNNLLKNPIVKSCYKSGNFIDLILYEKKAISGTLLAVLRMKIKPFSLDSIVNFDENGEMMQKMMFFDAKYNQFIGNELFEFKK